jgi:hypothetical protein
MRRHAEAAAPRGMAGRSRRPNVANLTINREVVDDF